MEHDVPEAHLLGYFIYFPKSKHPRHLPPDPEDGHQQDEKPGPERMRPERVAVLDRLRIGQGGDGLDHRGRISAGENLSARQLGDFTQDIVPRGLADFFPGGALHGNDRLQRGAAFCASKMHLMIPRLCWREDAGEKTPGFLASGNEADARGLSRWSGDLGDDRSIA